MESASEFLHRREGLQDLLLSQANLPIKRLLALDKEIYSDGALTQKTKHFAGLAASVVLRCNDCINYHLIEAVQSGATREEIVEILGIALVVGGSVAIPHLRHAIEFLETIEPGGASVQAE